MKPERQGSFAFLVHPRPLQTGIGPTFGWWWGGRVINERPPLMPPAGVGAFGMSMCWFSHICETAVPVPSVCFTRLPCLCPPPPQGLALIFIPAGGGPLPPGPPPPLPPPRSSKSLPPPPPPHTHTAHRTVHRCSECRRGQAGGCVATPFGVVGPGTHTHTCPFRCAGRSCGTQAQGAMAAPP